jgi:putative SOS response-associated peptidase YedK
MIITEPNGYAAQLHDRMPAVADEQSDLSV